MTLIYRGNGQFFTAAFLGVTYFSDPIITIGLSKVALTGGTSDRADYLSVWQAMLSIFSGITAGDVSTFLSRWNVDDHTFTGYIETTFPESKLKIFLEIGRNDIAWDIYNLILAPDHSIATVFVFRKYELFHNPRLFFGMEYTKLFFGRYKDRLIVAPWYERGEYEYSSYDGRRWVAHSGSDSDDFTIYFGWVGKNISIIPTFNYERHGLQYPINQTETGRVKSEIIGYPEVKFEFRLDLRYNYKDFLIYLYFEQEYLDNLEFLDKNRTGTIIWVGIEKYITIEFIDNVRKKIFN